MSEQAETHTGRRGEPPAGSRLTADAAPAPADGCAPAAAASVSVTTRAWQVLAVVVLAGMILISVRAPSLRLDNQANAAVLRFSAWARTPWLTGVAGGISTAGTGWGATVARLSAVALTIAFRRWRHLLVFLCSLFALELACDVASGHARSH